MDSLIERIKRLEEEVARMARWTGYEASVGDFDSKAPSSPPEPRKKGRVVKPYPRAMERWSAQEHRMVAKMRAEGCGKREISQVTGRSPSAIEHVLYEGGDGKGVW